MTFDTVSINYHVIVKDDLLRCGTASFTAERRS